MEHKLRKIVLAESEPTICNISVLQLSTNQVSLGKKTWIINFNQSTQ